MLSGQALLIAAVVGVSYFYGHAAVQKIKAATHHVVAHVHHKKGN